MTMVECPFCGAKFEENCEYVDVGVGWPGLQCTPNRCERCGSWEIGGYDDTKARPWERSARWFGPCGAGQDDAWVQDLTADERGAENV